MKVVIGIGPAGAGKSTWIGKNWHGEVICADKLRWQLGSGEGDQSVNAQVWAEVRRRVMLAIFQGRDVIVDATSARPENRTQLIELCRLAGAERIVGYWFQCSLAACQQRNKRRASRQVPEYAVERMWRQLEEHPPRLSEGFDEIVLIHLD